VSSGTRRVAAVAIAFLVAAAMVQVALAVAHRLDPPTVRPHPGISARTVGDLRLDWIGRATDTLHEAALAGGTLYAGSDDGRLWAFPASCGRRGGACLPRWTAGLRGTWATPVAAADGKVFVGSGYGLFAFPDRCAASAACRPVWSAYMLGMVSAPVVADGVVYVASTDWHMYAFPTRCARGDGVCRPLWTGGVGYGTYTGPVVSGGMVYVGSAGGALYAFPAQCRNDGGRCRPAWVGRARGSLSTPAAAGSVVYVASDTHGLFAFSVGCGTSGGRCEPLWTAHAPASLSAPAATESTVYVGSSDGSLYAFPASCRSPCRPAWTGHMSAPANFSTPALAGGLVFVGSFDGELAAFPATCGGRTCPPVWTAQASGLLTTPLVTRDAVYVGSDSGEVFAFRPAPAPAPLAPSNDFATAAAYLVVAAVVGLWARGGRRGRAAPEVKPA
jgi:outer membrane protein assembly factor BamB